MHEEINKKITANIIYLRKISGYTMEEVADYLHMTRNGYSRYESGRDNLDVNQLVDLSALYQLRPSVLLEPDKETFMRMVTMQRMGSDLLDELTDTYFKLSPFSQGCLLERAFMLLALEKEDKEIPR